MRFLMVAAAAVAFAAAAAFVAVFVIYSSASLAYFTHTHTRAHIASGFFFTFFVCLLFILHITLKLTGFSAIGALWSQILLLLRVHRDINKHILTTHTHTLTHTMHNIPLTYFRHAN